MYLKSIEMQGFKSFANKTVLQFHDGITGVVGPNGSGKSNVADAVRWVLGEQSAKQLRGGNMQDVIFSGTETRKPLGYASVAITLDNSDHKLNVSFEEVTVTRRLYRSGESEYLLNGSPCRLKDINELFYDTGIGKEGYSLIGQGQIDKILSGKPEERRELFDEAAGIVKFKRRKMITEKKLAEEQQNLVRVNDILSELTRQLGPMEKQCETAKLYLKQKEELKLLDINLYLLEAERIREELNQVEERFRIANGHLEDTTGAFERTRQEYEELEKEQEQLDRTMNDKREEASEHALLRQQLENQICMLEEQIRTSEKTRESFGERLEILNQDTLEKTNSLETCEREKEEIRRSLAEIEGDQKQEEAAFQELQEKIRELEQKSEKDKEEVITLLNQKASTKGKIQRYDAMLEQIGIRKAEVNSKVLQIKTGESQQKAEMERLQKQKEELSQNVAELKLEYEEIEKKIADLSKQISEKTKELEDCQSAYHREASRLDSLKNMTERYEGYGNSIRKVMEQKSTNAGIHGVIADLIQTDEKYETAIETALGGNIQNIVTDNEATAKYLIEYLKKGRFGRATFLPLTSVNGKSGQISMEIQKAPGVLGVASDLVSCDSKYEGILSYLLGRTVVVDTIDHAIVIGRRFHQSVRMVTLEGELLNPGGSMTGGSFRNNSNLLGRRREIEELEKSVRSLQKKWKELQKEVEESRKTRRELSDQRSEWNEKLQQQYLLQNTVRLNVEKVREKTTELRLDFSSLEKESMQLDHQIAEIRESRHSIEEEMESSAEREQELQKEMEAFQSELARIRGEENHKAGELEKIRLQHASLSQKDDFLKENQNRLKEEIKRLEEEKDSLLVKTEEENTSSETRQAEILEIRKTIESADEAIQKENEEIEELQKKKEGLNESHKAFFQKREELSSEISRLDKECFRLNNQKEKLEETSESQIAYLWEEYEITPNEARNYRLEEIPERSEMKRRVAKARDAIRKLGPVNVNAIEEFKELSERHAFLDAQHTDLVKAADSLKGIIEELEAGMRKQFTEKFGEIRTEFDRVFRQLFGGGKGTLELEEDVDILEAGIRIISQPPGKKLQNMMQLSGGEKALTAIALLFAIQNLKPSPFCLLDEIEAALDDSNVTRFAEYLHKLTKNTQFIVITHRRGTMTAADRLYGITMQEKGVSTLVSVDLIEGELDK